MSEPPPPFCLRLSPPILFVFFLFSAREIVLFTKEKGSKQLIVKEGFRTEVGSTGNVEMMRSEYSALGER